MTQGRSPLPGVSPWSDAGASSALAAEAVYCLVSAGTILFNKHALSTYQFPAPNVLLTLQFAIAVVLLKILNFVGCLHLEPLRWEIVKLWFPVNIVFVLMNATGFYALMSVSAGMFTVLKNLSNLLTILGDWYFFDKTYSWQVWACLGLMIVSAAMGGWSDLSFSASGYAWQLVNCVFTAAYSLHLSSVVRAAGGGQASSGPGTPQGGLHAHGYSGSSGSAAASHGGSPHKHSLSGLGSHNHPHGDHHSQPHPHLHGNGGGSSGGGAPRRRMSELSMVYYNNVLSVPPLLLLSLLFGEPARLRHYPHVGNPEFNMVVLMGALMGFGVSFASIWCMSRTSATIYSLTGSMNKVVVAVVGMWYFAEPATATNLLSIGMGLLAGFLFVFAKSAPLPSHASGGASGRLSNSSDSGVEGPDEVPGQLVVPLLGPGGGVAGSGSGERIHAITVSGTGGLQLTSRVSASNGSSLRGSVGGIGSGQGVSGPLV